MKRVYVETSVVSYYCARPSRDLIVAAHQQITRDWWETRHMHPRRKEEEHPERYVTVEELKTGRLAVAEAPAGYGKAKE